MLFCPKTVSQDNRGTSSLTDEAEHVMSGRMSNKSLEMEQVLLIRQKAFAAVRLTQGVTDLGLFSGTGKHFTQNPYHIRNWIFFSKVSPLHVGFAHGMSLELSLLPGQKKTEWRRFSANVPVFASLKHKKRTNKKNTKMKNIFSET